MVETAGNGKADSFIRSAHGRQNQSESDNRVLDWKHGEWCSRNEYVRGESTRKMLTFEGLRDLGIPSLREITGVSRPSDERTSPHQIRRTKRSLENKSRASRRFDGSPRSAKSWRSIVPERALFIFNQLQCKIWCRPRVKKAFSSELQLRSEYHDL